MCVLSAGPKARQEYISNQRVNIVTERRRLYRHQEMLADSGFDGQTVHFSLGCFRFVSCLTFVVEKESVLADSEGDDLAMC